MHIYKFRYLQPLALPIDRRCQGQQGVFGGWPGGGNKLKSSLNSFICLWKTLPSSHTHAARHTGHSQDTHLNDLWRKWRQVCRLSLSLSALACSLQCGQREANVAKSKSLQGAGQEQGQGQGLLGSWFNILAHLSNL